MGKSVFFVVLSFLKNFRTNMPHFCFEVFAKTKKFTNFLVRILVLDANRPSFTI